MDGDMNITATERLPTPPPQPQVQPQRVFDEPLDMSLNASNSTAPAVVATSLPTFQSQDKFREVAVKVHIRRPERDSWAYVGRGIVTHEIFGQGTRIVVRGLTTRKVITSFSEGAPIQAEKRGNFVIVNCVDGGRVVSWSLNALNNSETLRLLAIIELSCYSCKHTLSNPELLNSHRRKIARVIKDDRRKRHKRRKDQDAMVDAFAKTGLTEMDLS